MLDKDHNIGAYDELTGESRVKIANFDEIRQYIGNLVPDPRYLYIQVIAMGAGEFYGCNKNGDYFPERALMMYHKTFETNAKVFKEHDNRPSSRDYGYVPKAWYNMDMHRVELVLAIDKEKDPDTVARVNRGETIEVSMGARVPHDICSICKNKAAKKDEYCTHITYQLKQVLPDGRQVYMENLQPTFFDISIVKRRADKIALMLAKIASQRSQGNLDHVRDVPEELINKSAALTKRIQAQAVLTKLNDGMMNILPRLEQQERDLPIPLLDRIALRFSPHQILSSFLGNMVPMKPKEFARVIVVNIGLPLESQKEVLHGIMSARPTQDFQMGNVEDEISELLMPHLRNRSSYGPFLEDRVLSLGSSKTASYFNPEGYALVPARVPNELPYYSPMYSTELNEYRASHSTVPVMYSPEEYAKRRHELENRPPLRKPLHPFSVGILLGAMYAASRGASGLGSLTKFVHSDEALTKSGISALLATGALKAMQPNGDYDSREVYNHVKHAAYVAKDDYVFDEDSSLEKKAEFKIGPGTKYFIAPFVGSHLMSAHYRRKYYQGKDLNSVEKFVAENPDYLSIASPFVIHYASKKMPQLRNALSKIANFSDILSDAAVQGIIFNGGGRGVSALGQTMDFVADNYLMRKATNKMFGSGSPKGSEQSVQQHLSIPPKIPVQAPQNTNQHLVQNMGEIPKQPNHQLNTKFY
jgi:hypothetical protein